MAPLPDPESIDAVIFDAGGVLLLPDPKAGREAVAELGYAPADEEWRRAHYATNLVLDAMEGKPDWPAARQAFAAALGVGDEDVLAAVPFVEEVLTSTPWICIGGAAETLQSLAEAGYKLGVISNSLGTVAKELEAERICSTTTTGMTTVGVIVDSHVVGIEKPDPRIFHLALDALDVEASRAMFVGDTVKFDVRGAVAAGLHPVHMDPFDFCDGDHAHIAALPELVDWLDQPALDPRG